ncbi:hypothetical protein ACET3Z_021308 [Daucus carota]
MLLYLVNCSHSQEFVIYSCGCRVFFFFSIYCCWVLAGFLPNSLILKLLGISSSPSSSSSRSEEVVEMADQLSSSVELGLKLSRRVYYAEGGVDLNSLPHHQVRVATVEK